MVQFKAYEDGMMVNGATIMSILDAMSDYRSLAEQTLAGCGLGGVVADDKHWYSQQKFLDAFKSISEQIGPKTLYRIGNKIPEHAVFPPFVNSVETALASIDVAYHMNHKNKNGEVLCKDPTKPDQMLEGIGHYSVRPGKEPNSIIMVCTNPYPCDFDRGIIACMAGKFAGTAIIDHASGACRNNGVESCTYLISW
jgi:hypothetical protein